MFLLGVSIVAPFVGAWIETAPIASSTSNVTSHPLWVRGLKPCYTFPGFLRNTVSHPLWVRGLKLEQKRIYFTLDCRTLCGCVD